MSATSYESRLTMTQPELNARTTAPQPPAPILYEDDRPMLWTGLCRRGRKSFEMRERTFVLRCAVALALVAALAVPASALAASRVSVMRRGSAKISSTAPRARAAAVNGPAAKGAVSATAQAATRAAQRELLRQRIVQVLQARKTRFDAVSGRIATRSQKLSALADSVEKAGGDVSGVRTSIGKVSDLLAQASQQEALAVAEFQEVPDAAHPRVAFAAARVQARAAVVTLNAARITLRNAVLNLRAVATGLKAASK